MLKKIMLCLGLLGIAAQANNFSKIDFLHAIERGNISALRDILDSISGSDPQAFLNNTALDGRSALRVAASEGRKQVFMYLIHRAQIFGIPPGEYMNTNDNDFSNLFFDAASGGNLDIVQYILRFVPEENRPAVINFHFFDRTPLVEAAYRSHTSVVNFLLQNGADAHDVNIFNVVPHTEDADILKSLFNHISSQEERRNFFIKTDFVGKTPLMWAAMNSHVGTDIFMWMIEEAPNNGINLEKYLATKDRMENNIFYCAAIEPNLDIVEFLLNSFPKEQCTEMLKSKNKEGQSAAKSLRLYADLYADQTIQNILREYIPEDSN